MQAVSLKRVGLKPLLSFTHDEGKTSIEMLAGEYETVLYSIRQDDSQSQATGEVMDARQD